MAGNADYAVSFFIRARDNATSTFRKVKSDMRGLRGEMAVMSRQAGFHRVADSARAFHRSIRGLGGPMRRLAGNAARFVAPLTALAGGGIVAGTVALTRNAAQFADEIGRLSERTGIGVERLQELEFAFKQGGAAQEDARSGLRDFTKNLGEAAAGTGEAKDLFEALNIKLRDTSGRVRPVNDVLLNVADRLKQIEDPATRNAVAMKLFGDSGVALVNTLQKGSDGIEGYAARLRELGLISEEQVKMAKRLSDKQKAMGTTFTALGGAILTQVMPALEPMLDWMTTMIAENKEFMAQNLGAVFNQLIGGIQTINFPKLTADIRAFVDGLVQTVDWLGGWGNVAIGVAAIMHADLIAAVVGLTGRFLNLGRQIAWTGVKLTAMTAVQTFNAFRNFISLTRQGVGVWRAFGRVIRANPLVAFVTLAVGAVWLIIQSWSVLKDWFASMDLFSGLRARMAEFLSGLPDFVKAAVGVNEESLTAIRGRQLTEAEKKAADERAREKAGEMVDQGKTMVQNLLGLPTGGATGAGPDLPPEQRLGLTPRPAVAAAQAQAQVAGRAQIVVRFENAPAGLRVQPVRQAAGVDVTTEVEVGRDTIGRTL